MKVRKRTSVVDAWQYQNQPLHTFPPWVMGCTRWINNDLLLKRRSGDQIVNPTDWLVRDLDGEPRWLTDAAMLAEYEEVT